LKGEVDGKIELGGESVDLDGPRERPEGGEMRMKPVEDRLSGLVGPTPGSPGGNKELPSSFLEVDPEPNNANSEAGDPQSAPHWESAVVERSESANWTDEGDVDTTSEIDEQACEDP